MNVNKTALEKILGYIAQRAKEPTTWSGLAAFATALGVSLKPDQWQAIAYIGGGIAAAVLVLFPEAGSQSSPTNGSPTANPTAPKDPPAT